MSTFYSVLRAVHKVRHTIFDQFLPPPLSHFVTHFGTPLKVRHTSRTLPPIFSRTESPVKNPLYKISLNGSRGFCSGVLFWAFCLEGFVRGSFCPFPFLSEYLRLTES